MMGHLFDTALQYSAVAASSLINAVVEGALLTLCVGLVLHLCPRIKPAARFVIWAGVMFAALAFHFVPFGSGTERSTAAPSNVIHIGAYWGTAIVTLWSLMALARIAGLIRSAISLRHIAAGATPVVPDAVCEPLLRGARRQVTLCTSTEVDRPSVAGFFRPRILLPQSIYGQLSPQEREQIVLHEMEHLRRWDDWTNLAQKIGLALFPLNPALNWIERRLCMERELACDDCVLAATSAHKAYASCLTNLAEQSLLRRNISLALGAWGRRPELVHRVQRILSRPASTMGRTAGYAVTGVFLAGMTIGAVSLTRMPSLVSFSVPARSTATATSAAPSPAFTATAQHEAMPSATLVKAEMPQEAAPDAVGHTRSHRAPAARNAVHHQPKPESQDLLVLTGSGTQFVQPRLTLAISESTGATYAAVPMGNGWLVIQL
ncbi:MAG: M56 family metallopeptidase [Acidobacteria bacterium]|nr:M56 family metallopeptidase [Acidobacteriota bacterium]